MRITSGFARGISLDAPKGDTTRPATDAARQAVFSSLGEAVVGAQVLDIFAGTGSYGLEAASRGAAKAVFLETDRRALDCLRRNAAAVKKAVESGGGSVSFEVLPADCAKSAKILGGRKFDFVFADPPYKMLSDPKLLPQILDTFAQIASPETVFALEAPADFEPPAETFGENGAFTILKRLGKKSRGKPSQILFAKK